MPFFVEKKRRSVNPIPTVFGFGAREGGEGEKLEALSAPGLQHAKPSIIHKFTYKTDT